MSRAHQPQPDLFAVLDCGRARAPDDAMLEDDAEYLESLRERLYALFEKVTTAERLPFRTATQALLAELEFGRGIRLLPRDEAAPMHRAFNDAMWRLYAIDEGIDPPPPRPEEWVRLPLDDSASARD